MTGETILIGEFAHETNTFASTMTDRSLFQERREYFGDDVIENLRGTNTAIGGAVDVADTEGVDLIPTVAASAMPGGIVTADAYEFYSRQILEGVEAHRDELDGVLLPLHGAMVPEGKMDGEGPLVAAVRDIVGTEIPIVATHDLHGNVSDQLMAKADALVAYETYPHVDTGDTGRRGMHVLLETIRGELNPEMAIERPPLLSFGPKENTREGPMAEVMARARDLEERPGIRKVNVFPGFHRADVPMMGFSIPVVADGDETAAREAARELATFVWEMREEFVGDYPGPVEAVSDAAELASTLEAEDGPVVVADVGDNPGGGGAADGTTVLRELLDQGIQNAGIAIMRDPEVVDECVTTGVGQRVSVTVGGKTDDLHGDPIEDVDGYVKAITDGEFVNTGPMGTGTETHLGRTVHLECGVDDGVSVLLTENRVQPLDAEIWRHAGIQPERLSVLVVKSTNHYRADYEPMASHVIPANTPGLAAMDPTKFEFAHVDRPKFPIDEVGADYPDWD